MPIAGALNLKFDYSARLTSGSELINQALRVIAKSKQVISRNDYQNAARHICAAMPQAASIDTFVHSQRDKAEVELCAKLAIAEAILQAERKILLHAEGDDPDRLAETINVRGTWITKLFQLIVHTYTARELDHQLSHLTLTIFNYDRCVEHFLHAALIRRFRISSDDAANLISRIKIIHCYGQVGGLPWQVSTVPAPFGHVPDAQTLIEVAKGLRTFTERLDSINAEAEAIEHAYLNADAVFFLGFAFHPLNLQLLHRGFAEFPARGNIKIYGTAYGLSKNSCSIIKDTLVRMGNPHPANIFLENMRCTEMLNAYQHSLSWE